MKKFVAVLLVVVLIVGMSVSVFAARRLTEYEKQLINEIKGREFLGQKITSADIIALENYLMSIDKPLSEAEVNNIISAMDEIVALLNDSGAKSLNELPKDLPNKLLGIAQGAASSAGISVSGTAAAVVSSGASGTSGASKITITDVATGTPIVILKEDVIKKTGAQFDFPTVLHSRIIFMLTLLSIIGASVVLIVRISKNKKRAILFFSNVSVN